jgi:hypothetical protein
MDHAAFTPASWRVSRWCAIAGIARSKFYTLPVDQRPRSARVGSVDLIIESPSEYLERLARAQREDHP